MSPSRCVLVGHRWLNVPYDGAYKSDGFFLRCRRCAAENHRDPSDRPVYGAIAWASDTSLSVCATSGFVKPVSTTS